MLAHLFTATAERQGTVQRRSVDPGRKAGRNSAPPGGTEQKAKSSTLTRKGGRRK
jgi:hypothetical protein